MEKKVYVVSSGPVPMMGGLPVITLTEVKTSAPPAPPMRPPPIQVPAVKTPRYVDTDFLSARGYPLISEKKGDRYWGDGLDVMSKLPPCLEPYEDFYIGSKKTSFTPVRLTTMYRGIFTEDRYPIVERLPDNSVKYVGAVVMGPVILGIPARLLRYYPRAEEALRNRKLLTISDANEVYLTKEGTSGVFFEGVNIVETFSTIAWNPTMKVFAKVSKHTLKCVLHKGCYTAPSYEIGLSLAKRLRTLFDRFRKWTTVGTFIKKGVRLDIYCDTSSQLLPVVYISIPPKKEDWSEDVKTEEEARFAYSKKYMGRHPFTPQSLLDVGVPSAFHGVVLSTLEKLREDLNGKPEIQRAHKVVDALKAREVSGDHERHNGHIGQRSQK